MTTLSACCEKPASPQVFQPANLTAACPAVPAFEGRTSDDLVSAYLDMAALYADCSTRHNALVESLRP